MRGPEHRQLLARAGPYAAIATLSVLLMLPAVLGETRLNDSFWIDWVWLDQFTAELRKGVLYPRWLPLSHGGLGSPVFYYYPPLGFYVAAVFALTGLPTYASIIAAFWAGLLLSGLAMFQWLKGWTNSPLVGTLFYMAAPYHLLNFYFRGALAEFVATALIPLVALGIRWIAEERRGSVPLTAAAYAALIATHLPLALLVSLFLIVPYALFLFGRRPERLIKLGAALALGVALSAIYLLPALLLQQYRDAASLWHHPSLQPASWSLWSSQKSSMQTVVLVISAMLAVPIAILVVWRRSGWAVLAGLCALAGIGLLPMLWQLPLLKLVQFPFRVLPIVEFALATGIALVPWRPLFLTSVLPLPLSLSILIMATKPAHLLSFEQVRRWHPDVPENLPPGERPYGMPSRWALDLAADNTRPRWQDGVTVEPVFYFPAWTVRCDGQRVRTFPEPGTSLLAYRGRNCTRDVGMTSAEIIGTIISAGSLIILLLIMLLSRRRAGSLAASTRIR